MTFKEEFLKTPPGPKREELIYNEVVRRGLPKEFVPITVPGPNGTQITYKVMPDYLSIDGIRLPMSGITAQRIANHFGMKLPTTKMSKQIWDAADAKIKPTPMSAGAKIGDKYYSPQEVVSHKISDSDTAVAFNEKIQNELKGHKNPTLVAGHMKDLIEPEDPSRLGMTGWWNPDGTPIQKGNISKHDPTHSEYATGTRLVLNDVVVKDKNGNIINTTMDKIRNSDLSSAVSHTKGIKTYKIKDKEVKPQEPIKEDVAKPIETKQENPQEKQQSGKIDFLKRVEKFFRSLV